MVGNPRLYKDGGTKAKCTECGSLTVRLHPILNIPLCAPCQASIDKYRLITKTRAMSEYRLKERELYTLDMFMTENPHYTRAPSLQLFLIAHVEGLAGKKWGNAEPYIVQLATFSDEVLAAFMDDPRLLKQLGDSEFERLIAEFLEARGYGVQLVGKTRSKDGGVDIVAWPQASHLFPFLLAVQVKHHRSDRKTDVAAVRDFHGVIGSGGSPFQMGVIVTNTSFTADARWFGDNNSVLLRLRDLEDMRRWVQKDFDNPFEWREIPTKIELAPGVSVVIPKKSLWVPPT